MLGGLALSFVLNYEEGGERSVLEGDAPGFEAVAPGGTIYVGDLLVSSKEGVIPPELRGMDSLVNGWVGFVKNRTPKLPNLKALASRVEKLEPGGVVVSVFVSPPDNCVMALVMRAIVLAIDRVSSQPTNRRGGTR